MLKVECGQLLDIKQWGEDATAKPATATLPISCNIVVSAMSNYIVTKGSEYATLIYGTSTTTLSVMCDYNGTLNTSKYYWFAVCIQQWGYRFGSSYSTNQTVSYPLNFSSLYSVVVGTHGQTHTGSYEGGLLSSDTSSFKYCGIASATGTANGCSWVAIGI